MTGHDPVVNKNVHIRHEMNFLNVVENVKYYIFSPFFISAGIFLQYAIHVGPTVSVG